MEHTGAGSGGDRDVPVVSVSTAQFMDKGADPSSVPLLPLRLPRVLNEILVPESQFLHCETTEPRLVEIRGRVAAKPKPWSLAVSVWARRPQESQSKTFWDTPQIKAEACEKDWGQSKLGISGSHRCFLFRLMSASGWLLREPVRDDMRLLESDESGRLELSPSLGGR